jgi:hypothetical protein
LAFNITKHLSKVRIWDGSTPWLIHGYDAIRTLFTDSRTTASTSSREMVKLDLTLAVPDLFSKLAVVTGA